MMIKKSEVIPMFEIGKEYLALNNKSFKITIVKRTPKTVNFTLKVDGEESPFGISTTKGESIMYRSKEIEKYNEYSPLPYREGNTTYRCKVTYGMHYIFGNSQPYFSITAFTERRGKNGYGEVKWFEDSDGCLHDLIKKKAPHLAPLIEFHLCDQNGLPMYYLENGYYWYKENLETFKSYVRLSDDEQIPEVPKIELPTALSESGNEIDLPEKEQAKILESHQKKFITSWLKTREAKLRREFDETMAKFEVEYITQEEIESIKAKAA